MSMPQKKTIEGSIAAEIAALRGLSVNELQDRYRSLFGCESRSRNRDWLFKKLAFRMQEVRFGGLSERSRRRARELAKDAFLRAKPPRGFGAALAPPPQRHPKDPRLPEVGTVLTKEHGGEVHEITVLAEGFEYRGETYSSLSRIARVVTGNAWNGYLWLGLKKRKGRGKEAAE